MDPRTYTLPTSESAVVVHAAAIRTPAVFPRMYTGKCARLYNIINIWDIWDIIDEKYEEVALFFKNLLSGHFGKTL